MSSTDRNASRQPPGLAPDGIARPAGGVGQNGARATRRGMLAASLTFAAVMLAAMSRANARGGRTTAADCAAGSDDPDCPDTSDTHNKPAPKDSKDGVAKPDQSHN